MAFENIIDGVFKWEAGYQKNTKDKGNFYEGKLVGTNFGISAPTLAEYLGRPPTSEDMQNLTKEEAKKIYKINYYDRYKIDKLPEDIQEIALHSVVMSGSNGIKDIQKLIGVEADGGIGPNTLKALEKQKISSAELKNAILNRYKGYKNWDEFGKGWTNRYNDIVPETKKEEAPGKRSSLEYVPQFTGQETRVASLDDDMVYGGSANLIANQNLPNAPRNLGTVELPPDQTITPYRETIKEDVTVRPDQIRTTETIGVTAPRYSIGELQERARRSMMHGNYEDRMEDYKYDREYQEDYPYLYPRNTGSYALPQQQAAQRMMGGGMGYAQGGTVNQAQNMSSSNQSNNPGMSLAPPAPNQAAQGLASLGRGGDSTLVHMQPQEVAGLQQMAQANGTSLTTNPMTGMPEAFSLGNMFRAAIPIAAGYAAGPAGFAMFGPGAGAAIAAGAATGAGLAAMSGEDVLAGGLSGGLGGYSGMGLETALGGAGLPASGAGTVGNSVPYANIATPTASTAGTSLGGMQSIANPTFDAVAGSATSGLDANVGGAAGGYDPFTKQMAKPIEPGNVFDRRPGVSFVDQVKTNLAVPEMAGSGKYLGGEQIMESTGKMIPGDNLDVAMKLGSPAVSMGMGGLEASDFYNEPDFSDPRDKYDPYSKLNLNKDTGISDAMRADTGLRLFAEGGSVAGNQKQSLNLNTPGLNLNTPGNVAGNNAGIGGLNLNTGQMGVTPADLAAAARLKAIKDAKPNYKLSGSYNNIRVPADYIGGLGTNYYRDISGKYIRKYAEGGYLKGPGDGMSDDIPATINGEQPAALSTGEYVVSADVVSGLGNGSSEAGAKRLHAMMDRVRKATTGRKAQATEINPSKYMPA